MITHTCIKPECSNTYQDEDSDAYYCKSCKAANMAIAKEVDAQIASRPKRSTQSTIQALESGEQVAGPHGSKLFSRTIRYGN